MRKTIMVVEDDEGIRDIISILLSEEDYDVKLYPDVGSFKNEIKSMSPDLLITDVMLPDGNGLELCSEMRADNRTDQIPILMMSANASINDFGSKCTPDDFIAKPFNIDDFINRVTTILN
ncbi:response regulator transcription factor [Pedobacter terrae]|uniref:response regulator transcription factor n=1 Tax=Pedobacter terrae TaxID=405671 RepID=UPI002FF55A11